MRSEYSVRRASARDLAGALAVQHEAFGRVAAEHGVPPEALAPIRETLDDLSRQHGAGTVFYVATTPTGDIVGAVRAAVDHGVVEIGRLVVDGAHVRRGIATDLMQLLELEHSDSDRYVLFTGADATAALRFYKGLGYRETRTDDSGPVPLVWLEKKCPGADNA